MDDLKELLGEELYKQVAEKLGSKKVIFDTGDLVDKKDWIPKAVYNEDKQKLRTQLEERTTDLEKYKTQLSEAEGQPEKIAEIQKKMIENEAKYKERDTTAKAELIEANKKFAIELSLKDEGCVHSELLVSKVSLDSVVEVDGKWVVPQAAIDGLKEKYKENFGKIVPKGDPSPGDPDPKSPKQLNLTELRNGYNEASKKGDSLAAVKFRRLITEAEKK